MLENWKNEIATMVFVKQELMKLDVRKMWPHHFPEVAATEEQIVLLEKRLGHRLDTSYRSFLKFANGWKGFYQTVDLLGTNELNGSPMIDYANTILEAIEDDVFQTSGFSRKELLPIAATLSDKDVFVISRPDSRAPGIVIWFAGEEIDRFLSFEEYFLAMIDYNRAELEDLRRENKPATTETPSNEYKATFLEKYRKK